MVSDAVAFFAAFEGMEQGFRERARRVQDLLTDPGTAFVVVAAPRRDAVAEAAYFADRLLESAGRVETLIVNRMFPDFGPPPALAGGPGAARGPGVAALLENMKDLSEVAGREEQHVTALASRLPDTPIVRVPFLSDDVHDLDGLARMAGWLFGAPAGEA